MDIKAKIYVISVLLGLGALSIAQMKYIEKLEHKLHLAEASASSYKKWYLRAIKKMSTEQHEKLLNDFIDDIKFYDITSNS